MRNDEFWKRRYHQEWERHADNVNALMERLHSAFPDEDYPHLGIKIRHGATSADWEKYPPNEKAEADLEIFYKYLLKYQPICFIEVTGSAKATVPPQDIWILKLKYDRASSKETPTWFFVVYTDATYVLDMELVHRFSHDVRTHVLYGVPEEYIHIPCKEAYPENALFEWMKQQIEARK